MSVFVEKSEQAIWTIWTNLWRAGATACNGPYLASNFNFFMRIFYGSNCYKASFILENLAPIKTWNAAYIMCKLFIRNKYASQLWTRTHGLVSSMMLLVISFIQWRLKSVGPNWREALVHAFWSNLKIEDDVELKLWSWRSRCLFLGKDDLEFHLL